MILVGALSLVMAGILLVGYSLEQGLLGPGVRLALGLGFGLSMTVLAEWMRLRTSQSSSLTGAVSGAGSLVLAASLLAGHFLLSLVSMPVTFALLAALSLWMLERARHHGPWLAALGMLGGYALPLALPLHQQWQEASTLLLLGILLGAMMCFDLGGPVNKAAYTFGVESFVLGLVKCLVVLMTQRLR